MESVALIAPGERECLQAFALASLLADAGAAASVLCVEPVRPEPMCRIAPTATHESFPRAAGIAPAIAEMDAWLDRAGCAAVVAFGDDANALGVVLACAKRGIRVIRPQAGERFGSRKSPAARRREAIEQSADLLLYASEDSRAQLRLEGIVKPAFACSQLAAVALPALGAPIAEARARLGVERGGALLTGIPDSVGADVREHLPKTEIVSLGAGSAGPLERLAALTVVTAVICDAPDLFDDAAALGFREREPAASERWCGVLPRSLKLLEREPGGPQAVPEAAKSGWADVAQAVAALAKTD